MDPVEDAQETHSCEPPRLGRIRADHLEKLQTLISEQSDHIQGLLKKQFFDEEGASDKPAPVGKILESINKEKQKAREAREKILLKARQKISKSEKTQVGPTITNCLISEDDSKFIHLQYPGKVVNTNNALDTLGGMGSVSHVFSSRNKKLHLKFRPEDPYCNSISGDGYSTCGLIICVRRKKGSAKQTCSQTPCEEDQSEENLIDLDNDPSDKTEELLKDFENESKVDVILQDRELLNQKSVQNEKLQSRLNLDKDPERYYLRVPKDYQPSRKSNITAECMGIVYKGYRFNGTVKFKEIASFL